jgi:hypothetical protein
MNSQHRTIVPYDTGKIKIGIAYTKPMPKMDEYDEQIQEALLGIRSWKHTLLRDALLYLATCFALLGFLLLWTWVQGAITNA